MSRPAAAYPAPGGVCEGVPAHVAEHGETWLRAVFGFMGMEAVRTAGVAHGPEAREAAPKGALDAPA